jgi:hypothetical protein
MTTFQEFIEVCNDFHANSCNSNTGEFNFEKYRECVLSISEPNLNEKIIYFIDHIGPYVYCSDSDTFYIPTPGTDVFCEACEEIFNMATKNEQNFSVKVVSGKRSELSDFNEMLDSDNDFSNSLREDNRIHTLEHFEQLLTGGPHAVIPNTTYEESLNLCIRQCSELGLENECSTLRALQA